MKQLVNSAEFQGGENMENTPVCYIVANCNIETSRKTTDGKTGRKYPYMKILHKNHYSIYCNPNTATIRTQKQLYKPQTPTKNKQNKKSCKNQKNCIDKLKKVCYYIYSA